MKNQKKITILGGGISGLATGYFAKKNQINFEIFESGDSIGGNARTFEFNNFLYDSGAHRFHDKIPEITAEIKGLLKSDLLKISIPSHIYLYDRSGINLAREHVQGVDENPW